MCICVYVMRYHIYIYGSKYVNFITAFTLLLDSYWKTGGSSRYGNFLSGCGPSRVKMPEPEQYPMIH